MVQQLAVLNGGLFFIYVRFYIRPAQQPVHGHAQLIGQGGKSGERGRAIPGFPGSDRTLGHVDHFAKLFLAQAQRFTDGNNAGRKIQTIQLLSSATF